MTRTTPIEAIIDPAMPIVDAHHHLWCLPETTLAAMEAGDGLATRSLAPTYRRHARYLLDEFMTDLTSGHNVRASVFVEAHTMYRADGSETLRSVGEVEFANGIAAMAASGVFGDVRVCAGIVGGVDFTLGDAVQDVLQAHLQAGGGRYRGVRSAAVVPYDADSTILGSGVGVPHLLLDREFRAGFKWLERLGLSFEALLLEPQLAELIDLVSAFPDTLVIVNHVGAPVGVGRYAGQRDERFALWRENIRTLASYSNVVVKLGGLGLSFGGFSSFRSTPPATSSQLASEWKPYIDTCIEAFGVERCMFESNFPVDSATCTYAVLWNAFKRIVAGASKDEKAALFSGTAKRIYRLDFDQDDHAHRDGAGRLE
jgi:L-fuconolactonase